MNTFPEPDINETASHLAVRISTDPDRYTPGMRDLAKAYESQRERIADLEEDVERLRPAEVFVVEDLYSYGDDDDHISVETECRGGLTFTMDAEHGDIFRILSPVQSTQLTTALSKWAGLDGVEWREIDGDSPDDRERVLLTVNQSRLFATGYVDRGTFVWAYNDRPTHWAPLPKPPAVKS